ncbi:MAG TPA: molybdate ABC transporter substrate-binding protein [Steroidobacteraceae bacterium]
MKIGNLALALLAVCACSTAGAAESAPPRAVTVFAAASLTSVLQPLGREFTRSSGVPVRFSFAASSILARQIESGAGADVFVSADQEWMDYLEQRALVRKSTRRDLVGNRLVLIAPAASKVDLRIAPGFALAAALGDGRLAAGDPDSVPVGRYAKQALTSLGVWPGVADRLVRAEDVRHALMFVVREEAPLGIVYQTDALVEKGVRVVDVFPAATHLPISYPIAVTTSGGPDAERFQQFLGSDAAAETFRKFGFIVLH